MPHQKRNHEADEVIQSISFLMLFFSSEIDYTTINLVQINLWKIEVFLVLEKTG